MAEYKVQGRDVVTIKIDEVLLEPPFTDEYIEAEALKLAKAEHAKKVYPGQPFEDVENLLWIKSNTVYKEALEDWERQMKSLGERLERREKRSEGLTNQIYNLVGFFSVFQGVIFTAVTQLTQSTQAPRPLCGKVWFPFALLLLAAFAAAFEKLG